MVIQRDQPVHIWGHAAPDEAVSDDSAFTLRPATPAARSISQ